MKKIIIFFLIFLVNINSFAYADIELETLDEPIVFDSLSESSQKEPSTNSTNIIAIDRKTLTTLFEKNAYTSVPMASTTKIMTCIIAIEKCSPKEIVTVSKNAASIHGSTVGLKANTQISIKDLLYGLMLCSGNDCAIAIAEHISGNLNDFAKLMNEKAFELGLFKTNFVSPHGLDEENHFTSAYDLALLADYALKNSEFKKIVSTKNYSININGFNKNISNTNELLGNLEGVYGVKTGFTFKANRCLVTAIKQNNFDIIVVTLGADTKKDRSTDTRKIINYILKNFEYVNLKKSIHETFNSFNKEFCKSNDYISFKSSSKPVLKLEDLNNYSFPIKKDNFHFSVKIFVPKVFTSDMEIDSIVGNLFIYNNDTLLTNSNILLANSLTKNTWQFYFKYLLKNIFN